MGTGKRAHASWARSRTLSGLDTAEGSLRSTGQAKRYVVTSVSIRTGSVSYEAQVGTGLIDRLGELVRPVLRGTACALVADENSARHFGVRAAESLQAAGFSPVPITVPSGERAKSLAQAEATCEEMAGAGLDRKSFLVALGGGVVGDLAGFVAATYHRGIPWISVPTTLLAQVDSCIGGKTAVNIPAGKNLIGALHRPALVIADVDALATLPPRDLRQGYAEILKHAIIRDASLFDLLAGAGAGDFVELVRRNMVIKAEFVAADEREESGTRALLNFGHTVGHAIEQAGHYEVLRHGEAISLGIVAACEVSVRKAGLSEEERDRVIAMLERLELPTRLPAEISRAEIQKALPRDKKFEGGRVRFIVTPALGSARLVGDVTTEDIAMAVEQL